MALSNGHERSLHTEQPSPFGFEKIDPVARSIYLPTPFPERQQLYSKKILNYPTELAATPLPKGRLTGPVVFVSKLMEIWHLKVDDIVRLLGYEIGDVDYIQDILNGVATLRGRDIKDRIKNLVRIRTLLASVFRDEGAENEWLREPQNELNNLSPLDLLLEGSMDNMLLTKEFVEDMGGR